MHKDQHKLALDAIAGDTGDAFVNNLRTLEEYELAVDENKKTYFGFTNLSEKGLAAHKRARTNLLRQAREQVHNGYDGDLTTYMATLEENEPVLASAKAALAARTKLTEAIRAEWRPKSKKPARWKIFSKSIPGVINPLTNKWIPATSVETTQEIYRTALTHLNDEYSKGSQIFQTEDQAIAFSIGWALPLE